MIADMRLSLKMEISMKQDFILSLGLLFVSPLIQAQSKNDIHRIEKNQKRFEKQISEIEEHFNQDMTNKFQCFPEYQASFEQLKDKVLSTSKENQTEYKNIIGGIKDQLAPEIEVLRTLKERAKKNKEPGIDKIIEAKEKLIVKRAETQRDHNQARFTKTLKNIITAGGELEIVTNLDRTEGLTKSLNSCTTASCVYLIAADIKIYINHALKNNDSLNILNGITLKDIKSEKLNKIEKKIDQIAESLAITKPLGDFDIENCSVGKKIKTKSSSGQEDVVDTEDSGRVNEMPRDDSRVVTPTEEKVIENGVSEK